MTYLRRFRYAPRAPRTLAIIALFTCATVTLGYMGLSFEYGVVIARLIDLGPGPGSLILVALALISLALVVLHCMSLVTYAKGERYVELDEHAISVPSRWDGEVTRIAYANITKLSARDVPTEILLDIEHGDDEKTTIAASMLESNKLIEGLVCELNARMLHAEQRSDGDAEQ